MILKFGYEKTSKSWHSIKNSIDQQGRDLGKMKYSNLVMQLIQTTPPKSLASTSNEEFTPRKSPRKASGVATPSQSPTRKSPRQHLPNPAGKTSKKIMLKPTPVREIFPDGDLSDTY
jgi:hypothetical protein